MLVCGLFMFRFSKTGGWVGKGIDTFEGEKEGVEEDSNNSLA